MTDPLNSWLRSMPSPTALLVASDAFRRDAENLAGIDVAAFRAALDAVRADSGFLDAERIHAVAEASGLKEPTQQKAFAGFLLNLRETKEMGTVEDFEEAIRERLVDDMGVEQVELVVSRFRLLSETEIPGIRLQEKAERMQRATGARLRFHGLVTDLRPVFDDDRRTVEGMFPLTTLTLKTHDDRFDVVLTDNDLAELLSSVQRAERKSDALRVLLRKQGVEVPRIGRIANSEGEDDESA